MEIELHDRRYVWDSNWARLPDSISPGYTHGVVIDSNQRVYVFNQSRHPVLIFEPDGGFLGTWDEFPSDRFLGAHGMSLVETGDAAALWLTDQRSGEVVKTSLTGETLLAVDKPDHPVYRAGGEYAPTWATEFPDDGTIYVADGYGSSLINRYDASGTYIDSFDGSSGIGRFKCPHGIAILRRSEATGTDDWVLYVTDRGNSRVQIFDRHLKFVNAWYQDSPCCFASGPDGELLVPDLYAFVNVYDRYDRPVVTRLGDNQADIVRHHGWPNVPHELRVEGRFNSPHGGAVDADGNIYIVEWVEDGRITKLRRV